MKLIRKVPLVQIDFSSLLVFYMIITCYWLWLLPENGENFLFSYSWSTHYWIGNLTR